MKISLSRKKSEAGRRMEQLGIYLETILQFEKHNLVSVSEPPFRSFFWVNTENLERIKDFEEKYYAYLLVGDDFGEWELDRRSLKKGEAFAYVYSCDYPWDSEFGTVGIERTIAAGLVRTW